MSYSCSALSHTLGQTGRLSSIPSVLQTVSIPACCHFSKHIHVPIKFYESDLKVLKAKEEKYKRMTERFNRWANFTWRLSAISGSIGISSYVCWLDFLTFPQNYQLIPGIGVFIIPATSTALGATITALCIEGLSFATTYKEGIIEVEKQKLSEKIERLR